MTDTHDAFVELIDTFKELPETFTDEFKEVTPQAQIQGYRHLAHLLAYGFELYMESDPLRPFFVPVARYTQKILGDNTDSIYCFTQSRSDQRYRIWGKRGDACYLSFCVYAGEPDGSWSDSLALNVNHTQMDFSDDGSYEIFIGPDEPDKPNHFKMDPRGVCVISREYYFDRDNDRLADVHIENTADIPAPGPETDATLAEKFRTVANFVTQTTAMVPLAPTTDINVLDDPFTFDPDGMGWGTPDNVYAIGHFKLADDEVLVLRGRSPKCCYWGVQTWNVYMQSFDSRYHKVCVNSAQAQLNEDGGWTVYVCKEDPGLGNWVGTGGHDDGVVFCRWLLSEEFPESPTSEVVKRSSLLR
jgi:hypothetical protein